MPYLHLNEPASPVFAGGVYAQLKRKLGVSVSASSTPLLQRSLSTVAVRRRFSKSLSTARASSGNATPSPLSATAASAPRAIEQRAPLEQELYWS
jgi:hypothetical protein